MNRIRLSTRRNARALRSEMTKAERVLWFHLRNRGLGGCKFRRQVAVGPYILDFYCAELSLGVEVDGGQHGEPETEAYDQQRSRELASRGVHVVRYWNDEVEFRTEFVLEDLLRRIKALR